MATDKGYLVSTLRILVRGGPAEGKTRLLKVLLSLLKPYGIVPTRIELEDIRRVGTAKGQYEWAEIEVSDHDLTILEYFLTRGN